MSSEHFTYLRGNDGHVYVGSAIDEYMDSLQYPHIDFSWTAHYPSDDDGWRWVMNIPVAGKPLGPWALDVLKLQREYGCANVTSGNARPLQRALGVYVRDGEVKHREGKRCQCDWEPRA